ncbi:hypothetical protein B0H12DRAFT_1091012 [Mycena haematopus]|nr:hypothetical protein B0H12DRAFT_1091012 [Mycena haematopus]
MAPAIFVSLAPSKLLERQWSSRHSYISPVDPNFLITGLYTELISSFCNREGPGWAAFIRLFSNLGVADPEAATKDFLVRPPNLILAAIDESHYGCHCRIQHLSEYIFVSHNIWVTMENPADPMSSSALSAYEVMKATITHELAHTAVSRALGTLSTDLDEFATTPSKDPSNISVQDAYELKGVIRDRNIEISTPEKLSVPWKRNQGEAGEWLGHQVFGGILQLDSKDRAVIQTGYSTWNVLSSAQLHHARADVLINYSNEYDLSSPALSPSPSSALRPKNKTNGHSPSSKSNEVDPPLPQKCPGPIFRSHANKELSSATSARLLELLAQKRASA